MGPALLRRRCLWVFFVGQMRRGVPLLLERRQLAGSVKRNSGGVLRLVVSLRVGWVGPILSSLGTG